MKLELQSEQVLIGGERRDTSSNYVDLTYGDPNHFCEPVLCLWRIVLCLYHMILVGPSVKDPKAGQPPTPEGPSD